MSMRQRDTISLLAVLVASAAYAPALQAEDIAEPQPSASANAAPADAPGTVGQPGMEEASESRFRWGISAAGGPMVGAYSGGAGGIDARFGMQLSNMIG